MLHVVGQTHQADVSAGRLHIPKVRAYAVGKEKGHLRQSHVSRKSLWAKSRDTNAARHMLCRLSFSLHVPQRRQGYQTTSQSDLARRPGVTRAARTQKSRAVDGEKAPPAFSHSRMLQGQQTAHSQHRRVLAGSASEGSIAWQLQNDRQVDPGSVSRSTYGTKMGQFVAWLLFLFCQSNLMYDEMSARPYVRLPSCNSCSIWSSLPICSRLICVWASAETEILR